MTEVEALDPKYEIVRRLREGGMGTIYLVRHRLLEELRVIKVLRSHVTSDADIQERFVREAKTAIQLRHPNIAQLYDFSIDAGGVASIVMEYIDGVTLEEWGKSRPAIDLVETLAVARQSLRALAFLHRKGFVHRDISPDNLMLTRDAEGQKLVKLIDLGIVKILREESQATATALYLGKPRYSSPEQLVSPQVDARSDLYSFGVMLYELVTGNFPISGQDLPSIVTGHLYLPPVAFELSDPEGRVPESLRALLLAALAKKPEERPQSAEVFGRRLAEIERELARGGHESAATDLRELERLLAEAEAALSGKRLPEALAKLTEVLHAAPGESRAMALRARVEAAFAAERPLDEGDTQPFRTMPDEPTVIQRPAGPAIAAAAPSTRAGGRFRVAALGAGVVVVGALVAVALWKLLAGGDTTPPEYAQGIAAFERRDVAAAIPLLRAAAGRDPLERDGYLPFFELGRAFAAAGDCAAADSAFETSTGQGFSSRRAENAAAIAAARAACARAGLEPELVELESRLADLEGKVRGLEADRSNPALAELWQDPELGRELERVAALVREARALAGAARDKGSREPLFAAQDRFADAQLALGALLKKLAG